MQRSAVSPPATGCTSSPKARAPATAKAWAPSGEPRGVCTPLACPATEGQTLATPCLTVGHTAESWGRWNWADIRLAQLALKAPKTLKRKRPCFHIALQVGGGAAGGRVRCAAAGGAHSACGHGGRHAARPQPAGARPAGATCLMVCLPAPHQNEGCASTWVAISSAVAVAACGTPQLQK